MKKNIFIAALFYFVVAHTAAQVLPDYSAAAVYKKIQKLNFLGSVLYVAAHPDDENTAMISYLSNKVNARVGYLAMNRGDGGQNLLGTEIQSELGLIRTQELLAARKIDGAEQFFTRANDFGFSKNPAETFAIWDKDQVLSDVVWIFRKFRPDVIINRFNHRTQGDTHGHHTASAILSTEAFDLSGSQTAYSEQLKDAKPWQPVRLYFNDSRFFYGSEEEYPAANRQHYLKADVGVYLPVIGKSNTEIAALSRSQHKSQGFGSAMARGEELHFFEPVMGDLSNAGKDIFAGIDTSWSRIEGGKEIGDILYRVQDDFDFTNPAASIPELLKASRLIQQLQDEYWKELKTKQIKEVIAAALGLYLEVYTTQNFATLGEQITLHIEAVNRSEPEVVLQHIRFLGLDGQELVPGVTLDNHKKFVDKVPVTIPDDLPYSTPYWLREEHTQGMYTVNDRKLIGLPEAPGQLTAEFDLLVDGVPFSFSRGLVYKNVSQIHGELYEPFAVVPDVSVRIKDKVLVFADNRPQVIEVKIKAFKAGVSGTLKLESSDKNWEISAPVPVQALQKGQTTSVTFRITPPDTQSQTTVHAAFETGTNTFTRELKIIDYPHIPLQTVLTPTRAKWNRLDIKTAGKKIAYIEGAGDEIPEGLRAVGYEVSLLSGKDLSLEELKKYDAVMTGIRAYNVNDNLVLNQQVLFDYVKQGGTLVTQYSQLSGMKTEKIAPYPMELSHDRVTDENSEVNFLVPAHAVLNLPNKITSKDFEGWVQERGLYFPHAWDQKFTPVLGMHDQGEEELQGSLLIAKYGKGIYVYTGLSFFRELPAGVPGAYRLLANILALKGTE